MKRFLPFVAVASLFVLASCAGNSAKTEGNADSAAVVVETVVTDTVAVDTTAADTTVAATPAK